MSPSTMATTSMNRTRYGSIEMRYRSRLACSGVIPRKLGRERQAHHITSTTAPNMMPPDATNSTARVYSWVVNTPVLSTDSNHIQSV
ncbi:unannotated protein [freshwater metagenome]|uniref:Unannotated protein n=1 Tax=freshwater metagenome TaxID=449393 RepID=A0A6J7E8Y6_9ZZZZ